jgi:hypothetical protein
MAFQVTLRKKFSHNGMCPLDVNFPTEVCEGRHEREQRKGVRGVGGGERERDRDTQLSHTNKYRSHSHTLII